VYTCISYITAVSILQVKLSTMVPFYYRTYAQLKLTDRFKAWI